MCVCSADTDVPTALSSTHPAAVTPGSTEESGSKARSSGLPPSAPSPLPQNLLPLLGRGLSVSSLPGSRSPEQQQSEGSPRRDKAPASAAESSQGGRPSRPPPADTRARPADNTQTHSPPEPEPEVTTVGPVLDVDAETETPPSGITLTCDSITASCRVFVFNTDVMVLL